VKTFNTKVSEVIPVEFDKAVKVARIGSILLESGKISIKDEDRIIALQKQKGLRFGEAAKALGLINQCDIDKTLSYQFDFSLPEANEASFNTDLYTVFKPYSVQVEMLRSVRSQLMLRWFSDSRKFLAIASPSRREGRSSFVANLAVVLSQLGERTLLIDADLRQPRQHELFKLKSAYGLSDILAGRADLSAITKIQSFNNLSVLQAGTIPPNPSELISRELTKHLENLHPHFDIILFDAPAAEQALDVQAISSIAGGAILLARQHHTRLDDIKSLKTILMDAGCVCPGVVMTDF
jgi:protein-tyrosine kinase